MFFGGGTPSLLPLEHVERIMAAMRDAFDLAPDAEVSFEANPGTVDRDYLRGLRATGVNRICFGVQSFHDDELAALDRIHSAEEAKEAYRWAREAGFERINLDLIYGLTEQPMDRWQSTLEEAIALGPEHLSLYALTVEEGTKLAHDIERGRAPGPDGDLQAAMYEWSCERLAATGYAAVRDLELVPARARSAGTTWSTGATGSGSGWGRGRIRTSGARSKEPGARGGGSRTCIRRSSTSSALGRRSAASRGRGPATRRAHLREMRQVAFVEEQTAEMEMADTAILGLRLNEGLDVDEFSRRFGRSVDEVYGPVLAETAAFGLVERENGRVRLTERGRLLANEVFVRLLPGVAVGRGVGACIMTRPLQRMQDA